MSNEKVRKDYEELRFRDDFMFGKVMENKEICREVLECLLQRPIGELKELQTQKVFHYTEDGKPIRVDVYNEDSDRNIYDTEMENLNHKSVESHYLPQRSRFYQSSIDIDYMNKGNSYKRLPESNVMFICTFDPFGEGLSQYTFRERCDEDTDLLLNDGTTKIFYNCCYKGNDIPESLKELYEYIETGKAASELTKKIDAAVVEGRRNETWRTQYMKEWVIIQDARDEGIEEGIKQGREEGREESLHNSIERLMKNMGVTLEKALDILEVQGKERESIVKRMRSEI